MRRIPEDEVKNYIDTILMDDVDRELVEQVRKAIAYDDDGDPVKDAIDESEMIEAMRLLLRIIDGVRP